ncbi:EDD domain protein, DegV family [Granulicatella balaenopterae]|uniref:EDD domain protein, DegV family n=1 Tax=Granulicatella balaenopterae TaxID=137733 RepID=A0A1H9LRF9_9LACT|nr:DegV family protein [Granulicatella balaenopterae]SER13849.1 EDD domain protein, DegV family [Granulicatella balaenopterae]
MSWKIIVDSTCNLKTLRNKTDKEILFEKVPIVINLGEEVYIDKEDIDTELFISDMHLHEGKISTACASPEVYLNTFYGAKNIIVLSLSSGLSGSYNSAVMAQEIYQDAYPDANVFVYDTLSCAGEIDLLVMKAEELIEAGKSFSEVIEGIKAYHKHTDILFCLANMDNLVKNGRIKPIIGKVIGLLHVRLIGGRTLDGKLEPLHKRKGKKRALKSLLEELDKAGYHGGRVSIMQVATDEDANSLKQEILEKYPNAEVTIQSPSAVCCVYGGEEGILIGFEKNLAESC